MIWEPVPQPKKDLPVAAEGRLQGTVARLRAHRAMVARHYPMAWRVSGVGAGTGFMATALALFPPGSGVAGPGMGVLILAAIGATLVGVLWPATPTGFGPDCTCPRCAPPTDLR